MNTRAILLMVAAMAFFAVADLCVALASQSMASGQLLAVMGVGGAILFYAIAAMTGQKIRWRYALTRPVLARNAAEVVGTFGVMQSLAILPLASVTAILQVTPLAVTLAAGLILHETVGWQRWTAVIAGFAGVLIMIKPGADTASVGSLLVLVGVAGLTMRDLSTRFVPPEIATLELAVFGFASLIPGGVVLMALSESVLPEPSTLPLLLGMVGFAALAYFCVTASLRLGDMSAVTPFRYTRLVFAAALGIAALGQWPDAATLVGGAIVVAAGLCALLHDRQPRLPTTRAAR